MNRTVIRGGWILHFADGGHRLMAGGVVIVDGSTVSVVASEYDGHADRVVDARDMLVFPGFIDTHVHIGTGMTQRLIADTGKPYFHGQPFLHWTVTKAGTPTLGGDGVMPDGRGDRFAATFTIAELLRNGITTFVEVGGRPSLLAAAAEVVAQLGIRAYLGPGVASGHYADGAPDARWTVVHDRQRGRDQLRAAVEFIERHEGGAQGRIRTLLVPRELECCDIDLLREMAALGTRLRIPTQVHAAYSPIEWQLIAQAHGCTPVELLERCGMLGPGVALGHGNLVAEANPFWPGGRDLEILGESGTSVSHSPINIIRRGRSFRFAEYKRAGVNIALGTDTYPRDMIMQMRMASYLAKVMAADYSAGSAADVFEAATLGGARALGRPDLGRIAPGLPADIVVMSLRPEGSLRYGVIYDPIKAVIDCGFGDDVDVVMVDGEILVEGGKVAGVDIDELRATAQVDAEAYWDSVASWDPEGRPMADWTPFAFPLTASDSDHSAQLSKHLGRLP